MRARPSTKKLVDLHQVKYWGKGIPLYYYLFDDLIDLINQNFVLEVEASHTHSETTGDNGSNADFI